MHKLDKEVEDILKHWGVKGMKWDEKKKKDDEKKDEKAAADEKLVNDVIRGNYGNGEERKRKLGSRYREIQDMVNERLKNGSAVKGTSKPKPSYQHATVQSAKKKLHPSYQHATVQNVRNKVTPKNKKRSKSYLQKLKSKTVKELRQLFSKFMT